MTALRRPLGCQADENLYHDRPPRMVRGSSQPPDIRAACAIDDVPVPAQFTEESEGALTSARIRLAGVAVAGALLAAANAGAQAPASAATTIEEVIVTGRVQKLYRAPETTVGKMPGDPLDIPQAVQVVTPQLKEDQGARDVTDLYRNISGISFFSHAGVTFRGFRQEGVYYDGLRGDPFIGFSVPQLFSIERVEVLKGPAGPGRRPLDELSTFLP